jgi:putative glutamine amidotransferase
MTVAVAYTGTDDKHNHYAEWLRHNHLPSGNCPVPLVLTLNEAHHNLSSLQTCHGLLLSGGVDLHPSAYGGAEGYAQQPQRFYPERDQFETAAFKMAMDMGMPVLGVCRGLQLINCVLGGSLVQDLGAVGNQVHQFHNFDKAHGINIAPGSRLFALTGYARGVVNSAHHQAIERLGALLRSNCYADDGHIEGIEWQAPENHPFMMAVQWHPERMHKLQLQQSLLSTGIRHQFLTAVHRYALSHVHH